MEKKERKYYWITDKYLADCIKYISHENYFTYDDRYNKGEKIYSFKNTFKVKKALEIILNTKQELNN